MSDWNHLNKHRIKTGPYASDPSYGFNGAFKFTLPPDPRSILCIASDGCGFKHVSVSYILSPAKTPSWEVMCQVKDLFWEEEDWVVQFHPAKSESVNFHKGALHLWECLDRAMPTPTSILVGPKQTEPPSP